MSNQSNKLGHNQGHDDQVKDTRIIEIGSCKKCLQIHTYLNRPCFGKIPFVEVPKSIHPLCPLPKKDNQPDETFSMDIQEVRKECNVGENKREIL